MIFDEICSSMVRIRPEKTTTLVYHLRMKHPEEFDAYDASVSKGKPIIQYISSFLCHWCSKHFKGINYWLLYRCEHLLKICMYM